VKGGRFFCDKFNSSTTNHTDARGVGSHAENGSNCGESTVGSICIEVMKTRMFITQSSC